MKPGESCAVIEPALVATAMGEATSRQREDVRLHLAACGDCRRSLAGYRSVDGVLNEMRSHPAADPSGARERLLTSLSDLRSRLVRYDVFDTPLGPILLAATESGVALVDYLGRGGESDSRLFSVGGVETQANPARVEPFSRQLVDFLEGRRGELAWPLDLRFATSPFQRAVLEATAAVPFGAVSSYAGIAHRIGKPAAVRAVAQALRHNPLPIVVPCHRIVGSGGALVGYAGSRIGLKERLLDREGVATEPGRREIQVARHRMYAWDRRGDEYCLPTCSYVAKRRIGEVTLLASARQVRALGLSPCDSCHPDQHPLPEPGGGRRSRAGKTTARGRAQGSGRGT